MIVADFRLMLNGLYRCHIAAYALGIGKQLHVIVEIEVAEHTGCTGLIQGAAKIEHHLPAFVEFLVIAQTVAYVEALHIVFNKHYRVGPLHQIFQQCH